MLITINYDIMSWTFDVAKYTRILEIKEMIMKMLFLKQFNLSYDNRILQDNWIIYHIGSFDNGIPLKIVPINKA